jgi:hypothetical protein
VSPQLESVTANKMIDSKLYFHRFNFNTPIYNVILEHKGLQKYKKDCIFAPASPTRPAPADSPGWEHSKVRG